jgi:transposase
VSETSSKSLPQPTDLESARLLIATLNQQLSQSTEQLTLASRELTLSQNKIRLLEHELEKLVRRLYGRKTEKVDPRQLMLLLEGLGIEIPRPLEDDACELPRELKPRRSRPTGRRPLPKHLPRERVVIDVPAEEKLCSCGTTKVRIGAEVTEKLDYVPASFKVRETERPCYACPKCHEGVSVAPSPTQAVEKGLATEGLLAQVVVAKYADHLPLHRQEKIYARHGVDLPRSTLCDWVEQVAGAAAPIVAELRRQILATDYVQTDDTPVAVLSDTGGSFKGRVWTYLDPLGEQVVFDATPTHERDGPMAFLREFRGRLQADAYTGYDALYRSGRIQEVGCWAHARRRFVEALDSDKRAAKVIALIRQLYEVERETAECDASTRLRLRSERARPVLVRLDEERQALAKEVLPKSPLGDALRYLDNQWVALGRYLEDGRLRIDNNGAERQMRAIAVGRKNWLFAGSMEGARRAAILYSLAQSCRLIGIDPYVYFRDVLLRVATHPHRRIAELTPKGWAQTFAHA